MNLRRGLFRVWIAGSLLWIGAWFLFVWQSCIPQDIPAPLGGGRAMFCRTSLLDDWMAQPRYFGLTEYSHIVGTALVLPTVCLAVACGIGWVAKGFAR